MNNFNAQPSEGAPVSQQSKRKGNTMTIIKKEFARFFGDRSLFFTSVIMPGLLIYFIYSLMGDGIGKMIEEGANDVVSVSVENMPSSLAPIMTSVDTNITFVNTSFGQPDIDLIEDKDLNVVLMRFPANFDSLVASYEPASGVPAQNVEIYYNSANNASSRVYTELTAVLTSYEDHMSNKFDINRADSEDQKFDQATMDDKGAMIWSKLLPMLIIMMLFSGTMAIAPSAIAGEKERGTIATLLVTPMRRNELALGKVVSLSCMALLSGISSFLGIALSLPKMMGGSEDVEIPFNYAFEDYAALLLIILSAVLIMASAVSVLSAFAKDVKNAGTMITPFMLVIVFAGLMPMFQSDVPQNVAVYAIPFYNSIETLTAVFGHDLSWTTVIVTLVSNIVYAGLAVWGLSRMFNSEKIMFGK
jgi:sodium transport system permease protein